MEPNLYRGDYIIVSKFSYGYSRHSIPFSPPLFTGRLFFTRPSAATSSSSSCRATATIDYIKRLIGLPGDRIQVKRGLRLHQRQAGRRAAAGAGGRRGMRLRLHAPGGALSARPCPSGRSLPDQQLSAPTATADNTGVYVVPPHCYFMMGDNRDNSLDSRFDPGLPPTTTEPGCAWDCSLDRLCRRASRRRLRAGGEPGRPARRSSCCRGTAEAPRCFKPWTWFLDARPDRFFKVLEMTGARMERGSTPSLSWSAAWATSSPTARCWSAR